jgi:hypothetical protein
MLEENPVKPRRKIWIIGAVIVAVAAVFLVIYFRSGGITGKFDESYASCVDTCEDSYYSRKAKGEEKIELCSKINSENLKKDCLDSINYALAAKEEDTSFCDKINDELRKEQCKRALIFEKALAEENPDLCNELDNPAVCKDTINMELAISKAIKEDDEKECEILSGEVIINCRDKFFLEKGKEDETFCEKISDETLKDACLGKTVMQIIDPPT